jgi:hypothetical protein
MVFFVYINVLQYVNNRIAESHLGLKRKFSFLHFRENIRENFRENLFSFSRKFSNENIQK